EFVAAIEADRRASQALHGKREVGEAMLIGKRFADEAQGAHVEGVAGAAMGRRHGVGEDSSFAQRTHQCAAGGVGVVVIDESRHLRRRPFGRLAYDLAMLGRKERPGEIASVRHQSPSNTGLPLAAKASKARRKSFVCMHTAWAM